MDIRLAITGFGNVGQGIATLVSQRGADYERRYGIRLLISGVADRGGGVTDPMGLDPETLLATKRDHGTVAGTDGRGADIDAFLDASGAHILVEAASTSFADAEPGWSYVRGALARRMDVVLASKGCLALYWRELFGLAREADRSVLYSATVGAPVPALQLADRVLVGATISGFDGILNGTTHQILTAMAGGASYDDGIRQAQEMGIAETDPTLDVDGWDAAAKAVIVANSVFGTQYGLDVVERQGIRGVTTSEIAAAGAEGGVIKLIARARYSGESVRLSVAPEARPLNDALGRLSGDAMGIVFYSDPLGTMASTYESGGASGGIVTAMTCLRDVFNLARDRGWGLR